MSIKKNSKHQTWEGVKFRQSLLSISNLGAALQSSEEVYPNLVPTVPFLLLPKCFINIEIVSGDTKLMYSVKVLTNPPKEKCLRVFLDPLL